MTITSRQILGVRLDDVTLEEAVALIGGYIAERGPHLVATTNTEFVMAAQRDPEFRRLLNDAALSLPDGIGLIWGLRLLGERQGVREHVRGTDLVERLMAVAAARGQRVFLLGAAEGVAAEAAARLRQRYPTLRIAGCYAGSPDPAHDAETRAVIRAAGTVDILLVAYGGGKQERWIARNLGPLDIAVGVGVGGVFDFLAGRVPRAPRLVRRLELEWLYRLIRQPWRWRRQLALPHFALRVLLLRLRR
ncbi:MAG TPA: WecB/TagA/CpsF family glycosyltransferase [Thermomicrobiaceae bacterium]|nr:WecB/TagA/CpsF family glycosyltransferase [Thermomicrobiaceae bacterium]